MAGLPSSEPGGTDARGAHGVQSGEGNLQINIYAESQSVVWPHRVGSVPLLADCYQYRERETATLTLISGHHASSVSDGSAAVDEQDCRDALANLHRLNLISLDSAGGARAIRTHALVQRATLEGLSTDAVSTTVRAAADTLVQVWPDIERDTELGRALRDCAANLRKRHGELLWEVDGPEVLFRAGRSLGQCGLVRAAVDYWTEMVTEALVKLGVNHSDTLTTRQHLAWWRGEAGDPAAAAAAYEQLLTDRLRVPGTSHNHTLGTCRALARWQGESGDPIGATAALRQLLTDCLRVLGPDHPETLRVRDDLVRGRGQAGDAEGNG